MTKNVPHIYEHFQFDEHYPQKEDIQTFFWGGDLVFCYWIDQAGFYITLAEVFDMMHSGRKVTREDFKHTI